jgi:hypothetical protein
MALGSGLGGEEEDYLTPTATDVFDGITWPGRRNSPQIVASDLSKQLRG